MNPLIDYIDFDPSEQMARYIALTQEKHEAALEAYSHVEAIRERTGVTWPGNLPDDYPDREAVLAEWKVLDGNRTEVRKRYEGIMSPVWETIPKAEQNLLWNAQKRWYCQDSTGENERENVSPSGKYRVVITSHTPSPGSWGCTKGRVYEGDRLIAEVLRNYMSFPVQWCEDHPNGHDYLLTGEDYQGQTIIELDTGDRRDYLSPAAGVGVGFCFIDTLLSPDKRTLLAQGCYWACPYELRWYDFTDPMGGPLPLLSAVMDDCDGGGDEFGWQGDGSFVYWAEGEEDGKYDREVYTRCTYDLMDSFRHLVVQSEQTPTWDQVNGIGEHMEVVGDFYAGYLARFSDEEMEAAREYVESLHTTGE